MFKVSNACYRGCFSAGEDQPQTLTLTEINLGGYRLPASCKKSEFRVVNITWAFCPLGTIAKSYTRIER
jgi:hypothetical protein